MKKRSLALFFRVSVMLLLGLIMYSGAGRAVAAEHKAVLFYPELRAPFSNVFDEMIRGVETVFHGDIRRVSISKSTTSEEIGEILTQEAPELIFTLGSRTLQVVGEHKPQVPVLAAGITRNGSSTTGISMLPDPWVVFDKLFLIKGKVDRVYVVSRADRYDEQLERAGDYLNTVNSTLEPIRVASIQEAAKAYRRILDRVKPGDAIWILPSAPYLDNSVLSVILEQAWKRRILVFSSNPSHVKRGVLFAVYPDNLGMGVSLGKLGNRVIAKDDIEHGLQPLRDVLLAVNERTTKHLGIDLDEKARSEINLMLPAR